MSVKLRRYRRGGWEVDIRVERPDGSERRERRRAPVSSKTAAKRWGEAREHELVAESKDPPTPRKEVPTLRTFVPRFLKGHTHANRQKPSGIAATKSILRVHLVPALGAKRLDAIGNEDAQRLKAHLRGKSPKTVNNVLTVLNTLLKAAVEWEVIDQTPCRVRLLPIPPREAPFHDFDEFEQLVDAARRVDARAYLLVLLGGEAGLRCGEMMALEWPDVDLARGRLVVQRSDWKGHVTVPKGGRPRHLPLTARLAAGLRNHRHLRGRRVLTRDEGAPLTQKMVQNLVGWSARKASVRHGVHILRHTFCSHLAMRGAPARAIQDLAGHKHLSTTQRYMHLSPAALESAIRLLDRPKTGAGFGDMLETGEGVIANSLD